MNKIRVIDLLNKIAKGEEVPKKIKYQVYTFEFNGMTYIDNENDSITEHILADLSNINNEVEIIEEDTFEDIEEMNLDVDCTCEYNFGECYDTINQLIRNQKKIISKLEDNQ